MSDCTKALGDGSVFQCGLPAHAEGAHLTQQTASILAGLDVVTVAELQRRARLAALGLLVLRRPSFDANGSPVP